MNILRRTFLAMSGCVLGSALLPPTPSRAASPELNSAEVSRLFQEFGADRRMPPALNAWLNDPARQKLTPYRAFDNI